MSDTAPTYLCPCGKALEEPLERVGRARAMCGCGLLVMLTPAAQAAYAERAGDDAGVAPEPPPAGDPEPTGPARDPAPADAREDVGPAGASSWSDAEISAPAQLPEAAAEPDPEPEPAPPPPPPRRADLGDWLAG